MKTHMDCDVVILDFDGTIVNSMPFLTRVAVQILMSRHGMQEGEARRAYTDTCGLPFIKQLEIIRPSDSHNPESARLFEQEKTQHLLEFELFADVRPAVEAMRKQGRKVCVSSGNSESLIRRLLESKGVKVDLVMGYRDGFMKGREHFEFARRHFKTSLDRIVFVGDSWHDAQMAKRVGISFIARIGLLSREQLETLLPGTPVVNSLLDVLDLMGIEASREKGEPKSS